MYATTHSILPIAIPEHEQTAWMSVRDFRHDASFSTAEHSHPAGQLIAVDIGLLTVDTVRQRLLVPGNCAVWIPPGQLHGYSAAGPHAGWAVYVSPQRASALAGSSEVVAMSSLLREALKRASAWPAPQALNPPQEHLAAVIIDEVNALPRELLTLPWPSDQRLIKIAQAFAANPSDVRTLPEWAEFAGLASRTLSRRFIAETGLSFSDWRRRVRLLAAMTMLAAGRPVTSVALELGYDSLSAFSAMFKQMLGMTPSAFAPSGTQLARI